MAERETVIHKQGPRDLLGPSDASEKMVEAMKAISEIVNEFGMHGVIVLHSEGDTGSFIKVDGPETICQYFGGLKFGFAIPEKQDEAFQEKLENTRGMLKELSENLAQESELISSIYHAFEATVSQIPEMVKEAKAMKRSQFEKQLIRAMPNVDPKTIN